MKSPAIVTVLLVLSATLTTPSFASLTLHATIGQNIQVVFDFEDIDSALYNQTKQQDIFGVSTIPETIKADLEERNLENVDCVYDPTQEIFEDSTKSIHIEFALIGLDIIQVVVDNTTRNKVSTIRTDWRRFQVNLTSEYVLDFTEYFGIPLREWEFHNQTSPASFYFNRTDSLEFDAICSFTLPNNAINPRVAEDWDTIIFELPPSLGESLLNSPFSILIAIVLVNVIAVIYRRIRK
ncbi:MAG: hypothetical protein JSV58_07315 [Candidatus Bathyarchaeota archaeon]|nr:MAG: hypothetical protein JSV58_07315 [Candidatus Bathyarchaeota archaeon]